MDDGKMLVVHDITSPFLAIPENYRFVRVKATVVSKLTRQGASQGPGIG